MPSWGRWVLGLGAIVEGGAELIFHTASPLALLLMALELVGGLLLLWPGEGSPAVRNGGWLLTVVYLIVTATTVPAIAAHPLAFTGWGVMGEELSRLCGAVMVVGAAATASTWSGPVARAAYWAFVLCVVSFAVFQIIGYADTASLVPRWLPPSVDFWAVATTVAFFLAAAGMAAVPFWPRLAGLATQLLTAMLIGFALLVWAPIIAGHPHTLGDWTELAETVSIAGAAWLFADWLAAQSRSYAAAAAR